MNVMVMTSSLTFVPHNYQNFVDSVLKHDDIKCFIECDNHSIKYLLQGIVLIFTLAAPRMGYHLVKNYFGRTSLNRKRTCQKKQIAFQKVTDPHQQVVFDLIEKYQIDLIIHARTRFFLKKKLLQAPPLGCINIHHGLLPEQRGLMCDFWAHLQKKPTGFSVHVMTSKLDDGAIVCATQVPSSNRNYLQYLDLSAKQEAITILKILEKINDTHRIETFENNQVESIYHRNPGILDFYRFRLKGFKI